mmetsp:Transcript_9303/g.13681  ORF Transcript_9303/g.13681 Transcript_9303/m.13681 type:complete len:93 (-) Transcript_9303:52-330(-)
MPCSRARDMPNVDLPVPGPPPIRINFGGSFTFLKGGGELNARRCFMEADNDEVDATRGFGGGLNADVEQRMHATRRLAAVKRVIANNTMAVQ